MTRFDAVLWDLDGTILDSAMAHYHTWRELLAEYGHDYAYADFLAGFGQSNRMVLTGIFPEISAEEIAAVSDKKERMFRRILLRDGAQMLPGVTDWLQAFGSAGLVQVLSSSAPMANITTAVHALDVGDFFAAMMSGAHLPKSKPDPMLFLQSAAYLALPPARCLVIEDSVHGVEAARRAGMACVVVGALAADPALDTLLAATPGPGCLRTASLSAMTWAQLEELAAVAPV